MKVKWKLILFKNMHIHNFHNGLGLIIKRLWQKQSSVDINTWLFLLTALLKSPNCHMVLWL